MFDLYRVVCWEENNQIFADIYPAGESRPENSITHDTIFMMRQKITPNAKRVETGILLTDLSNGSIELKYEKVYNKRMKMYQDSIRKKIDPIIVSTFKEMKRLGKNRTFEISLANMSVLFDIRDKQGEYAYRSARQDELIREKLRIDKANELKKIKIEYYANAKYATNPHIVLAYRQAMYRGG